jgi:DNA-binding Lrp family transcriptional regulator
MWLNSCATGKSYYGISKQISVATALDKKHLDKTELGILRVLIDNSRETLSAISEKTETPLSTVRNKFNGLVSKGVIKGFTAFLDVRKLGMVGVVFFIKCGRNYGKVVDAVTSHPNVGWVMELLGEYDVIGDALFMEMDDIPAFKEWLLKHDGVMDVRIEVLKNWVSAPKFPTSLIDRYQETYYPSPVQTVAESKPQ